MEFWLKKKKNPEVFTGHRIEGLQSKSEVKLERGQAYKDWNPAVNQLSLCGLE